VISVLFMWLIAQRLEVVISEIIYYIIVLYLGNIL